MPSAPTPLTPASSTSRDQLWKRLGKSPQERLHELQQHPDLVRRRDDLSIELCALHNQTGNPDAALALLQSRNFQPWEGGEGLALGQHVRTHLALGQRARAAGNPADAFTHFQSALTAPLNLGEAKHLLANQSDIHYFLGLAHTQLGDSAKATRHFTLAADARGDFHNMSVQSFSEMTMYSALALRALHRYGEAEHLLTALLAHAQQLLTQPAKIDYFATSLPTMLLFDDDLQKRQARHAHFLAAQAHAALGNIPEALRLLRLILDEDPHHAPAADLLASTSSVSSCPV